MMEQMANLDFCYGEGCPLKHTCWRYIAWMSRDDLDGCLPPEWFIAPDYDVKERNCVNYVRKEFCGM